MSRHLKMIDVVEQLHLGTTGMLMRWSENFFWISYIVYIEYAVQHDNQVLVTEQFMLITKTII